MKLIVTIINPYRAEEVRDALTEIGINGLTLTDVKGFGRQKGHKELYRGAKYTIEFLPKCKIEVVVSDNRQKEAIEAITHGAKTGKIGDGKIFVFDQETTIRIRTGETGGGCNMS